MKSNVEDISSLEKKLNIHISPEEVNAEFNKAFKYLQKNVGSKGFRKGKTPITVIRKLYSEKISGDVTQGLVEYFYPKALKEHKLFPSGQPSIDSQNAEENKEFNFTACFEILPEIGGIHMDSLEVEKQKMDIDDNSVDESIENILKNEGTMEDVILIRELKQGDYADIDFILYEENSKEKKHSMKNYILEIGSDSFFIPGFEESLLGMKPGEERTLNLNFPDNSEKSIHGKTAKFEVTLNKIKKKIKPELNDKFVEKISSFQTVEEFKINLKKNLTESREKHIKEDLKEKIFQALVKNNPFEVPKSLLEKQKADLSNRVRKQMKERQVSDRLIDEHLEAQKEDLSKKAEFTLKCGLLIRKIVEENNFKAAEKDFEDYLKKLAKQLNADFEKLKKECDNREDIKQNFESDIIEEKVFEFLLSKAKVTIQEK